MSFKLTSPGDHGTPTHFDYWTNWVKENLKARQCNRFTCAKSSPSDDGPKCQCGKKESDHDVIHLHNPRPESKWQVETHTEEIPVDAFGEIKFRSTKPYPTKFVRADIYTDPEVLWTLLREQWELPPPKLVITVTGGTPDWQWNARHRKVFQKGLIRAAQSTDAWIFTGGRKFGMANVVGDAVREHAKNDSYVNTIGLTTWGSISQKEKLLQQMPYASLGQQDLDAGHSHFLMFDDGTINEDGIENLVWGKIVQKICEKHLHEGGTSSQEGVTIPSICLTASGTIASLATVYENIIHGTPCLVIEDTGTMADILTYAVKHAKPVQVNKDKKETTSNINTSKSVRYLSNADLSYISRQIQKYFGTEDLEVSLDRIKVCVNDPRLIATYRMDDVSESADGLLNAVVNLIVPTHNEIKNQLELAITWNTVEVARSTIFGETTDWPPDVLSNCFQYAITQNAIDFVDLFIDNGAVLKKEKLEEIYNENKDDTLPPKLLQMKKDNGYLLTLEIINDYIETMDLPNMDKAKTTAHCSWQDVFLYAVITNRKKLAEKFWKHLDEPIMDALVACKILQKMKVYETDTRKKRSMERHEKKHEEFAIGVLNECYEKQKRETFTLMTKKSMRWGNYTCMEMAFIVNSQRFLAHPAPQLVLKNEWRGNLSKNSFKLWLCTVFPPATSALDLFREEPASQKKHSKVSGHHSIAAFDVVIEEPVSQSEDSECVSEDEEYGYIPQDRRVTSKWEKLKRFYSTPAIKFQSNVVMQLIFLLLFSYIMLTNFRQDISWQEYVLISWVVTIILEELRQCFQDWKKGWFYTVKKYFAIDSWNIMDTVAVTMFVFGTVLRNFLKTFEAARIILALDLGAFCLKFLQNFFVSRDLGPKLIMINRMIQDMLFFMCLLIVFVVGYGVTYFAIMFPNESSPRTLFSGIFSTTFLQIFGENLLEDIEDDDCSNNITLIEMGLAERCPQYPWIGRILLYIYMMLSTVLLINLLIAMLSFTFTKVQEQNDECWKYYLYIIITEYVNRPALPPPFNIVEHLASFCGFCWDRLRAAVRQILHRNGSNAYFNNQTSSRKGEIVIRPINQGSYARDYLLKQQMKVRDTVEVEIDGVFKEFVIRRSCVKDQLIQIEERVKLLTSIVREDHPQQEADDLDDGDDYVENEIPSEVHYHSRTSPYPGTTIYCPRVPSTKVNWKETFVEYKPVSVNVSHGQFVEADPELWRIEKTQWPDIKFNEFDEKYNCNRKSFLGKYELDEDGFPRNPRGRTGRVGRGTLKRYGPNHRIDCVITRWKKTDTGKVMETNGKKILQFLAIKKTKKEMAWYLFSSEILERHGLSRQITEYLLFELDFTVDEKDTIRKEVDKYLSSHPYTEVYKGYVDETRNTDNAWVEVEARNYHEADKVFFADLDQHLQGRLFKVPKLKWMDVESSINMRFTSYKDLLRMTAENHDAYF